MQTRNLQDRPFTDSREVQRNGRAVGMASLATEIRAIPDGRSSRALSEWHRGEGLERPSATRDISWLDRRYASADRPSHSIQSTTHPRHEPYPLCGRMHPPFVGSN